MRKKCKDNKGFTLLEMITCVATLVLICLICTTGMNLALKSYSESMFESQSQVLESMINTSVGDLLRFTDQVSVEGGKITFNNSTYGVVNGTLKLNSDGYFLLKKDTRNEVLFLAKSVYVDEMYIDSFVLNYDTATHVFTGSYTIKSKATSNVRDVNFTFKSVIES